MTEVIVILVVIAICIVAHDISKYSRKKSEDINKMSFRESIDLTGIPIITFYNNDLKINMLLDTGSDLSYINKGIVEYLTAKEVEGTANVISIGGQYESLGCRIIKFSYKDQVFEDTFYIQNLSDAFAVIKSETGVQIHGILGSKFFERYKYVLDFKNFVAYSKQ